MKKLLLLALLLLPFVTSAQSFTRNLYVGLSGPDVAELQQKLRDLGFYAYPSVTGWYGPVTAQAVSRFQQAYAADILIPNGLAAPTGTFGPATRAKLASLSGSQPQAASAVPASGGGTIASSDPGCPAGFSYSFLTGQPCARVSVSSSASSRVSQSTPARSSRSGGSRSSSRSDSAQGNAASPSNQSNASSGTGNSSGNQSGGNSSGNSNNSSSGNSNAVPARPGTIIPAGPGFSGPTPQPAAVGNSSAIGYRTQPIAHWDVVPFQTFSGNFNVGVVAFHSSDIDYVAFSANGGPWIKVSRMTANPQTANVSGIGVNHDAAGKGTYDDGVVEYWATLKASDFPDGPVEVRAIVYPKHGVPRVLESLSLSANSNNTLNGLTLHVSPTGSDITGNGTAEKPYATILHAARYWIRAKHTIGLDNATIYLQPGSYSILSDPYPHDQNHPKGWLTITPAPGVSRNDVKIVSSSGTGIQMRKLHWKNVTFQLMLGSGQPFNAPGAGGPYYVWIDGCNLIGPGRSTGANWTTSDTYAGIYLTDSSLGRTSDGFWNAEIVRNVSINDIQSDSFRGTYVIINTSVRNVNVNKEDGAYSGAHADIYQWLGGSNSNHIFYGLDASAYGSGGGISAGSPANSSPIKDVAIVNTHVRSLDKTADGYGAWSVFYLGTKVTNFYIKDSIFDGGAYWWYPGPTGFQPTDMVIDDTDFVNNRYKAFPGTLDGVTIRKNGVAQSGQSGASPQTPSTPAQTTPSSPSTTPDNTQQMPSPQPVNLINGLMAHYQFDGSAADGSGNGNNGTLVGNPGYVPGRAGQALSLNGVNQSVTTTVSPGSVFTLSAWIKPGSAGASAQQGIFKASGSGLVFFNPSTRQVNIYDANGYVIGYPPPTFSADTWGLLTIASDGSKYSVYVNGSLYKTYTYAAGNWATVSLGKGSSHYFNGLIDDVRIYNRALSASEVQSLASN